MNQSRSLTLQDRSRFVRLLTELSAQNATAADYNLAERLGNFVGVSGSMNLARGLRGLPLQAGPVIVETVSDVKNLVLTERQRMISVVVESFSLEMSEAAQSGAHTSLPSIATGVRAEALKTFEPYQRFYTTHQVELAVGVRNLRLQVRAAIAGFSTAMHQLAELDKTLDDSLEAHTRKLFSVSPKVLEQRFKALAKLHGPSIINEEESAAWLTLFYQDIRELLLAELDLRLQPVLGLLEALNEHEDTKS